MQDYEIAVLYDPGLEVDLTKSEDRFKKIITDNKGKIKDTDNWGKRKLAYPIAKNEHAIYVFYTVELEPASLGKIESTLNITNEIIRYLIVKIDHKELAKAELARKTLAEKAKKSKSSDETKSDDEAEE